MIIILHTQDGQRIDIEKQAFAAGGEGTVHKIIDPSPLQNYCAKLYLPNKANSERERKLRFMVDNPPPSLKTTTHIICWPLKLLFKQQKFIGFIMPLAFTDSTLLYDLTKPSLPQKLAPIWNTKFELSTPTGIFARLKLCNNIAGSIYRIHQLQKYVLVDLKPSNILVTHDGKISVIDCDSFQIYNKDQVIFAAKVATPNYMPPEGFQQNLSSKIIPQSWDYFSLAIIFYEILFGLHPYAATFKGIYQNKTAIEDQIQSQLFVHGSNKKHIQIMPPLHNNFKQFPSPIKDLFFRALESQTYPFQQRPSTEEWAKTFLMVLNSNIIATKPIAQNKSVQHKSKSHKNSINQKDVGIWILKYLIAIPFTFILAFILPPLGYLLSFFYKKIDRDDLAENIEATSGFSMILLVIGLVVTVIKNIIFWFQSQF